MPLSNWSERTADQLVRYEALFALLDEMRALDQVEAIAARVASRWKYFANVAAWRLVVGGGETWLVIDGARGEAATAETDALHGWDLHHWRRRRPACCDVASPGGGPPPPPHLSGRGMHQILVLPFARGGRLVATLSVASRHRPLDDLDERFIRLFGSHLADRLIGIRLQARNMAVLVDRALRDGLTGLDNRNAILEHLAARHAEAQRSGTPLSVLLVDIDVFKSINDRHGHLAGDAVLREVARRLREACRATDRLGRYGGEEFLFVLEHCGAAEAMAVAERIRLLIETCPCSLGEAAGSLFVTISGGTATTDGRDGASVQALIKRADDALYRSKQAGRNRMTAGTDSAHTATDATDVAVAR